MTDEQPEPQLSALGKEAALAFGRAAAYMATVDKMLTYKVRNSPEDADDELVDMLTEAASINTRLCEAAAKMQGIR